METTFIATIAFALLALAGVFLANLAVLLFTASPWHVWGVIAAILAAAFSYWSQHSFTQSFALIVDHPTAYLTMDAFQRFEAVGRAFQLLGIVAFTASVVCFWLGMR